MGEAVGNDSPWNNSQMDLYSALLWNRVVWGQALGSADLLPRTQFLTYFSGPMEDCPAKDNHHFWCNIFVRWVTPSGAWLKRYKSSGHCAEDRLSSDRKGLDESISLASIKHFTVVSSLMSVIVSMKDKKGRRKVPGAFHLVPWPGSERRLLRPQRRVITKVCLIWFEWTTFSVYCTFCKNFTPVCLHGFLLEMSFVCTRTDFARVLLTRKSGATVMLFHKHLIMLHSCVQITMDLCWVDDKWIHVA